MGQASSTTTNQLSHDDEKRGSSLSLATSSSSSSVQNHQGIVEAADELKWFIESNNWVAADFIIVSTRPAIVEWLVTRSMRMDSGSSVSSVSVDSVLVSSREWPSVEVYDAFPSTKEEHLQMMAWLIVNHSTLVIRHPDPDSDCGGIDGLYLSCLSQLGPVTVDGAGPYYLVLIEVVGIDEASQIFTHVHIPFHLPCLTGPSHRTVLAVWSPTTRETIWWNPRNGPPCLHSVVLEFVARRSVQPPVTSTEAKKVEVIVYGGKGNHRTHSSSLKTTTVTSTMTGHPQDLVEVMEYGEMPAILATRECQDDPSVMNAKTTSITTTPVWFIRHRRSTLPVALVSQQLAIC